MDEQTLLARPAEATDIDAILAELCRRGAERSGHGRGTVLRHLHDTYTVLVHWRQPRRLCLAGLLHNAYSTEAFGEAMFAPSERVLVRSLIGPEAERLVHYFGAISLEDFLGTLDSGELQSVSYRFVDRRGGAALKMSRRDVGDLIVLYLANVADQACMSDGGPTYWLAATAALARHASRLAEVVPAVLNRCRSKLSVEAETVGLDCYDTALRYVAHHRVKAGELLGKACEVLPWIGEPMIWRGILHINAGEQEVGLQKVSTGLKRLELWGTQWDKRLSLAEWRELATKCSVPQRENSVITTIGRALDGTTASPRDLFIALEDCKDDRAVMDLRNSTAPDRGIPPRFRFYLRRRHDEVTVGLQGPGIYPGLSAQPFYHADRIPFARDLEAVAKDVVREFSALQADMFVDEAEDISRTGRWTVLFLQKDGNLCEDILARCPVVSDVLDKHASAIQGAGVIYFSCLAPGTRVAPHRGATNTRLRCHLGLEVPDDCGLLVGGEEGGWKPERCTVFDDSFIHSVWNNSPHRRVVLIADIWHPDLLSTEVDLLRWMSVA